MLAGCQPSSLPSSTTPGTFSLSSLKIALKPDKDPETLRGEQRSLSAFMSEELGIPVEVIVPQSTQVILEGFSNGSLDLGYLSATDLVLAQRENLAKILLVGQIDGKTTYQSYWLCLIGFVGRMLLIHPSRI